MYAITPHPEQILADGKPKDVHVRYYTRHGVKRQSLIVTHVNGIVEALPISVEVAAVLIANGMNSEG